MPHGTGFNYSLIDASGAAAAVEASPAALAVREGEQLACSNHFQSPELQAYNRRNPGSHRHLPPLEGFARDRPPAAKLFEALNRSLSPVFDHRYSSGSGTLHTIVCTPASRQMLVGVGGDASPETIDFKDWLRGALLNVQALEGQLGGTAKPFDPSRRIIAKPGHGSALANVFIGTHLKGAIFKDLSLANAKFDDIDFSNAVITGNCNFRGVQIAGIAVADLFAASEERQR